MYLDSAYIAKYYLNEVDSISVRRLLSATGGPFVSSSWAVNEVNCVFHRHYREGGLNKKQYLEILDIFKSHAEAGVWVFMPVTQRLIQAVVTLLRSAPPNVYLRAGDAIHLVTARDLGETEIWTNDRHLLAAAQRFGMTGRSAH